MTDQVYSYKGLSLTGLNDCLGSYSRGSVKEVGVLLGGLFTIGTLGDTNLLHRDSESRGVCRERKSLMSNRVDTLQMQPELLETQKIETSRRR